VTVVVAAQIESFEVLEFAVSYEMLLLNSLDCWMVEGEGEEGEL